MVRLLYTVRCGREPTDISSIVLVEPGGCFIKSDAVLRIAAGLDAPLQLLAWLGELTPRGLRDPLYDAVRAMPYPPPLASASTPSLTFTDSDPATASQRADCAFVLVYLRVD